MVTLALVGLLAAHPANMKVAQGVVCFKSGEQAGGMTKICYYNCLGNPVAITIGGTALCPLTINR